MNVNDMPWLCQRLGYVVPQKLILPKVSHMVEIK